MAEEPKLGPAVKKRMLDAMKAKDVIQKEILKVVLGELDVLESRTGKKPEDAEVVQVLKKLVKSNEETLSFARTEEERAVLRREVEILTELLPATLGVEEVALALAPVKDALVAAPSDGAGVGVAMKHLKTAGIAADGKVVAEAVRALRAG